MELEEGRAPDPVVAKRLWNIVKIMLYMIRKGVSKRRLMVDLHLIIERSKIAGKKAIGSLMFHHHPNFSCHTTTDAYISRSHPNFSCHSTTDAYIFAPREYEFSCSNSPAFPSFHHFAAAAAASASRRKPRHSSHNHFSFMHPTPTPLHKALDSDMSSTSSSPVSVLPGFGKSPMVRQLRITDSPFPLMESGEENSRVDKEAEEFIEMFYEQLRRQ